MLKRLTQDYIEAFDNKDINKISALLDNEFALEDPVVKRIEGKVAVLQAIEEMFNSCNTLSFQAKNIYQDNQTTIIEFVLKLDEMQLTGTDIIEWENNKMKELRAYLDIPKDES